MDSRFVERCSREELDSWDDAFEKVENYFRAHRIQSKVLLSELVPEILNNAYEIYLKDITQDPVLLAAEAANKRLEDWFRELVGEDAGNDVNIGSRGRLALLLTDAPYRWSKYMLRPKAELPSDFVDEFCASYIQAGPSMDPTSMVPKPIDLGGITKLAESTLTKLSRWPIVRTLLLWGVIFGILGYVFWLTR